MGHFINFCLPYANENGTVSPQNQAFAIITEAEKLIGSGAPGVAITYSANYGQTVKIHESYESGGWDTQTNGANQAEVMHEMETLLGGKYSSLQRKLQIAPITTMTYSDYGGKTHQQVVESDLAYIKSLLDQEWDVLGWQNQDTKPKYAVGGGVASLPADLNSLIQSTLSKSSKLYCPTQVSDPTR